MIRIRFTADAEYRLASGPVVYAAGSEHDLRDDLAKRWIRRGVAVELPAIEAVAIEPLQVEPTHPPAPVDPEPVVVLSDPVIAPAPAPAAAASHAHRPRGSNRR